MNRLIADGNTLEVIKTSSSYLEDDINDLKMMYTVGLYISAKTHRNDNELKTASLLLKSACEINPNSLIYLELLASLYNEQGKQKKQKTPLRRL